MLNFSANLSFLFQEAGNLSARYLAAKKAGFCAVECMFPNEFPENIVQQAKEQAGVKQALLNSYAGSQSGDLGLAVDPTRQSEFKESIEKTIRYAKALDCHRVHVLAGKCPVGVEWHEMESLYIENILWASHMLQKCNIETLIEPINNRSVPNYFLNSYDRAVGYIEKIKNPMLKLQLDIFHLQIICGDITENIKKYLPYTGHIQIAQVPDRHEPDSSGELNYTYVFKLLQELGYSGYIGCEYIPATGKTEDGLGWLREYQSQSNKK